MCDLFFLRVFGGFCFRMLLPAEAKPPPSMWTLVLRMRLSAMRVRRGVVPALAIFSLLLLALLRVAALGVSLAKPVGFSPALVAAAPNAGMAFGVELPAETHTERSAADFAEAATAAIDEAAAAAATSPSGMRALELSDVAVGVLSCRRFLRSRCRTLCDTWLRRFRRVAFFSDRTLGEARSGGSAHLTPKHLYLSTYLSTPLIEHTFVSSDHERILFGGNWRVIPMVRTLTDLYFSASSHSAMVSAGETPPRWALLVDDDAYIFTDALLDALRRHDAEKPYYLGYAFLAAPHLESLIPGERQLAFANGGAGVALSRGALLALYPYLDECERRYSWNWPGDVRLAQCLSDASVSISWERGFHAESPQTILLNKSPPPGSVPVGLTLPPISFHHVDAQWLVALETMSVVPATIRRLPYVYDFGKLALIPLAHAEGARTLSITLGYQVTLTASATAGAAATAATAEVGRSTRRTLVLPRASIPDRARLGRTKLRELSTRLLVEAAREGTVQYYGESLASFRTVETAGEAVGYALGGILAGGTSAGGTSAGGSSAGARTRWMQVYEGGECLTSTGVLIGGASARVHLGCGGCEGGGGVGAGARICSFREDPTGCVLDVWVALGNTCPTPRPLLRVGLDLGTSPSFADVARDGQARAQWAGGCDAAGQCMTVRAIRRASGPAAANLTLYARVLRGSVALAMRTLQVGGAGAHARLVLVPPPTLSAVPQALSGATTAIESMEMRLDNLEPAPGVFVIEHQCPAGVRGLHKVSASVHVHGHVPIRLGWQLDCQRTASREVSPRERRSVSVGDLQYS